MDSDKRWNLSDSTRELIFMLREYEMEENVPGKFTVDNFCNNLISFHVFGLVLNGKCVL